MVNKILYIFFLLSTFFIYGKDALSTVDPKIKTDQEYINKATFEKNFKSKYTDDKFIYEFKTPEKNAWDRFLEWLGSILNGTTKNVDKTKTANFLSIIIRVIVFLIIAFVVYLIAKALINKEGSWIFSRNSQSKIIDYEEVEKNIHLADFKKLITEAEANGDIRLATRYLYLWLLKKMTDANIIDWHPEKTNADYSYEIKNDILKEKYNYLSYLYSYIWYGEFDITNETYQKTKQNFENTYSTIR